jgi:hypothetical protein
MRAETGVFCMLVKRRKLGKILGTTWTYVSPSSTFNIVINILPALETVVSNIINFILGHLRLAVPRFQVYHHPRECFECLVAAVAFHVSRIVLLLVLLAGQVSAANVIHYSIGITVTVPFVDCSCFGKIHHTSNKGNASQHHALQVAFLNHSRCHSLDSNDDTRLGDLQDHCQSQSPVNEDNSNRYDGHWILEDVQPLQNPKETLGSIVHTTHGDLFVCNDRKEQLHCQSAFRKECIRTAHDCNRDTRQVSW